MWSDNETELDLLGVSHLSGAVKRIVRNPALLPTTIGLFGDWGSGKTSLGRIVLTELEDTPGILCVTFNGWQQEGFEDAKAGLIGTILDALVEKRDAWNKAKDALVKVASRLQTLKLVEMLARVATPMAAAAAGGVADPSALGLVAANGIAGIDPKELGDLIKESPGSSEPLRKSAREFHRDFDEVLKKTDVDTLVVLIDDLDRCLPSTILDTLEAIRLFLYSPRTAFIICADARHVRAAVRHKYPQAEASPDIANEYLEKLVQFPIMLPPLSPRDVSRYMTLLFAELHMGTGFPSAIGKLPESRQEYEDLTPRDIAERLESPVGTEMSEAVAIVEQIGDDLGPHMNGNPRQVKRFLNTLMLRIGMAEECGARLQRRTLAKLMLLEYVRLDSFRQLAQWQAEQAGTPTELVRLEGEEVMPREERAGRASPSSGRDVMPESAAGSSAEQNEGMAALWRSDEWLQRWLRSEPKLAGIDLRPYFYVARENLGTVVVPGLRLSALAEKGACAIVS